LNYGGKIIPTNCETGTMQFGNDFASRQVETDNLAIPTLFSHFPAGSFGNHCAARRVKIKDTGNNP